MCVGSVCRPYEIERGWGRGGRGIGVEHSMCKYCKREWGEVDTIYEKEEIFTWISVMMILRSR